MTGLPLPDFTAARDLMVDGQLRPTKVTDRRVLDAMRQLPRERFVKPAQAGLAYIDEDVAIGPGRVLLKPLVLARLIQLAAAQPGENALIVGAGSGYGAAVLAACGAQVTALEEDDGLLRLARAAQDATRYAATWVSGKLADGWAEAAPYDLIIIEGAVRAIPERLGRQLAEGGRLITIISPAGGSPYAVVAEASTRGLAALPAFDAVAPLLPSLVPAPEFAF